MIDEQKARAIAEKITKKKALSCTYYQEYYVFTFGLFSSRYVAVSKDSGKAVNFTPAVDPIGFGQSEAKIYSDYFNNRS